MSEVEAEEGHSVSEPEQERLEALYRYDILDTAQESDFDGLTRLASRICNTPVSLINLMDLTRQWTKSSYGLDLAGYNMPRKETICHYTIQDDGVTVVENLSEDERFSDKWYIKDDPNLKFYAGAPLITHDGYRIGSICVMDKYQRKLTIQQMEDLQIIAKEVISELELRHRQKKLEEVNKQKDKLIRTVSHDLRNPLIGIIGTAEIIQDEYDFKELLELIEIIEDSGEQMYSTISELLDSGMLETEQQNLNTNPEDIMKLLKNLKEVFQFLVDQKSQTLKLEVKNRPPRVQLDRHKYSRMVGNLVSNAIKFTPKEGLVTIELDFEEQNDNICRLITRIKDTGMGIPEEYIPVLFSGDNEQIRRAGTQAESSYGMGLAIVKQLVDLHEGDISVESEEGAGTTFEMHLPVEKA